MTGYGSIRWKNNHLVPSATHICNAKCVEYQIWQCDDLKVKCITSPERFSLVYTFLDGLCEQFVWSEGHGRRGVCILHSSSSVPSSDISQNHADSYSCLWFYKGSVDFVHLKYCDLNKHNNYYSFLYLNFLHFIKLSK